MSVTTSLKSFGTRNKVATGLLVAGALLLIVSVWLWWAKVYNSPYRVFWGAMENSLATSGVTRHISQTDPSASLEQTIRLALGPNSIAYGTTTINQKGEQGDAKIVTESIGTADTDYVRYTEIKTLESAADGGALDFSSVLGVWGKSESSEATAAGTNAAYFNESLLGIMPFANVPSAERSRLIAEIRESDVFEPAYDSIKKRKENGRTIYEFTVKVNPQPYIAMLQKLVASIGVNEIAGLDPSLYAGAQAIELQVSVDPLARQFTEVSYASSGRKERFSDYGLKPSIALPADAIPVSELQSKLQAIQ